MPVRRAFFLASSASISRSIATAAGLPGSTSSSRSSASRASPGLRMPQMALALRQSAFALCGSSSSALSQCATQASNSRSFSNAWAMFRRRASARALTPSSHGSPGPSALPEAPSSSPPACWASSSARRRFRRFLSRSMASKPCPQASTAVCAPHTVPSLKASTPAVRRSPATRSAADSSVSPSDTTISGNLVLCPLRNS
mmetsp:Transcript_67144/g.216607  ORF Transcript_67144/g.216607 Transcript_67144/m.216607 type:complete len:200 (+) Transcript_67144:177-776(+)